jgi:hypothetical protein
MAMLFLIVAGVIAVIIVKVSAQVLQRFAHSTVSVLIGVLHINSIF